MIHRLNETVFWFHNVNESTYLVGLWPLDCRVAGSNPTDRMNVRILCPLCAVSLATPAMSLITRPEES